MMNTRLREIVKLHFEITRFLSRGRRNHSSRPLQNHHSPTKAVGLPSSHPDAFNCLEMEITKFVIDRRDSALLLGDYNTYRAQLSRRLLTIRRKLGRTTAKNAKYAAKAPITAEEIGQSHEYVC